MKIIRDIEEMRGYSREARQSGERVIFVPTMGFLHDGHGALLKQGRKNGGVLVMSIFVNPAQFGPNEDYGAYPRDIDGDLSMAEAEGVDAVFIPAVEDIYPSGFQTYVEVEALSRGLCGAGRPGHFRGVATVVLKLFNIVMPNAAFFGEKDFQQLAVIRRMVSDMNLGVEVVGVPTVRETDGVAMSSRNAYLSANERLAARCIPEAIKAARDYFAAGGRVSAEAVFLAKKVIENEPLAMIEYLDVCDPSTLLHTDVMAEGARVFAAVRIGRTRLIDNAQVEQTVR